MRVINVEVLFKVTRMDKHFKECLELRKGPWTESQSSPVCRDSASEDDPGRLAIDLILAELWRRPPNCFPFLRIKEALFFELDTSYF